MKRHDPQKRELTEQRTDSQRHYGRYIADHQKGVSKINPIFLQDHYGIKEPIPAPTTDSEHQN